MMNSNDEKESKKRKCNQEEDQPKNCLDCLPSDLSLDIISRLPIKSLIQSRFACKSWHRLSFDPHLVGLQLSRALKGNPYFIFHCSFPIKNLLYFVEFSDNDDDHQEKICKIDAPFSACMPEYNVIGSCNGILCLENSLFDDSLYVYNPFTGDYKELPKPMVFEEQQVMYGFGFHPITNQYKLIRIVYYASAYDLDSISPYRPYMNYNRYYMINNRCKRSNVQVFCLGSHRWKIIGEVPYQLDRRSSAVLVLGKLHWTSRYGLFHDRHDRIIVSFDLSDELFREVPNPEFSNRNSRINYEIASLGGCLCAVVPVDVKYSMIDIWIMKEYDRKESWVKEFSFRVNSPDLRTRDLQRSHHIWRNILCGRSVRVLCILKNGEILVEHTGGSLVSYNPKSGMSKNVKFPGLPFPVKTIVHVGSLVAVDAPPDFPG